MLKNLRGCERFCGAAARDGCGYLVADLYRVLNTHSIDNDGTIHVDMAAGQRVLNGFVGIRAGLRH